MMIQRARIIPVVIAEERTEALFTYISVYQFPVVYHRSTLEAMKSDYASSFVISNITIYWLRATIKCYFTGGKLKSLKPRKGKASLK